MNIGFCGEPGSGKTTGVTLFTLGFLEEGKHGFGNYAIKHPNYEQIDLLDIVDLMRKAANNPLNCPMYNAVLPLTEIYTILESRVSASSHVNLVVSYLVFQARKLGIDIIWDAQLVSSVDLRLRELTDLRFMCEKLEDGFLYTVLDRNFPAENIPTSKKIFVPFELAEVVWQFYDSWKINEPVGMADLFVEMEKTDYKKLKATVDRQARLLQQNKRYYGSVISVELALMDAGESPVFAKYVKERLSSR